MNNSIKPGEVWIQMENGYRLMGAICGMREAYSTGMERIRSLLQVKMTSGPGASVIILLSTYITGKMKDF